MHVLANAANVEGAEDLLHLAAPLVRGRARTMLYNTMLKACARAANLDRAEFWFSEMERLNVELNHKTFGKLIDVAAKAKRLDVAERVLSTLFALDPYMVG